MVKKLTAFMLAYGMSIFGIDGTKVENFSSSHSLEKRLDDSFIETKYACYPNTFTNGEILKDYKIRNPDEVDFHAIPVPEYISKTRLKEIVDSLYTKINVPKLVSKDFFMAAVETESSYNINAVSPVGARGLAQIMPETWSEINPLSNFYLDGFKPEMNLSTGLQVYTKVYHFVRQNNPDWDNLSHEDKLGQIIAGYNWGIGNLEKYASWNFEKTPQETKMYLRKILKTIG